MDFYDYNLTGAINDTLNVIFTLACSLKKLDWGSNSLTGEFMCGPVLTDERESFCEHCV